MDHSGKDVTQPPDVLYFSVHVAHVLNEMGYAAKVRDSRNVFITITEK